MRFVSWLHHIGRQGVAAVEFALVAPVMILVLLAGTDVVTSMRVQIRLETTATQLGQIVSQCPRLTTGDAQQLFTHGQRLIGGIGQVAGGTTAGAIIITAVYRVGDVNRVAWQQRSGSRTFVSSVGPDMRDQPATVDGGFIVPPEQTLIVTEIFLQRNPWILTPGFFGGQSLVTAGATRMYLTRAVDAAALSRPPEDQGAALVCFA